MPSNIMDIIQESPGEEYITSRPLLIVDRRERMAGSFAGPKDVWALGELEMSRSIRLAAFVAMAIIGAQREAGANTPSEASHRNRLEASTLDLNQPAPRSLHELVDRIYESLPEEQLHLIAAYYGGRDYDQLRAQYPNLEAFYEDLRITPILTRAAEVWRFHGTGYALYPRIACVGRDFSTQVALQIAIRYMRSIPGQFDASESERGRGFRQASYISRRLFEVCDHSAANRGRAAP